MSSNARRAIRASVGPILPPAPRINRSPFSCPSAVRVSSSGRDNNSSSVSTLCGASLTSVVGFGLVIRVAPRDNTQFTCKRFAPFIEPLAYTLLERGNIREREPLGFDWFELARQCACGKETKRALGHREARSRNGDGKNWRSAF